MPDYSTQAELLAALEEERLAYAALLPRFDDERWTNHQRADGWNAHDIVAHLADSHYGMALMLLGEIKPTLPLSESGWMDVNEHNDQRRQKNASVTRAKIQARLESGFAQARRAIEGSPDLEAPGPYGPVHSRSLWLNRMIVHSRMHRVELEELLS